eukprot:839749-Prymnesium_polylepis.2
MPFGPVGPPLPGRERTPSVIAAGGGSAVAATSAGFASAAGASPRSCARRASSDGAGGPPAAVDESMETLRRTDGRFSRGTAACTPTSHTDGFSGGANRARRSRMTPPRRATSSLRTTFSTPPEREFVICSMSVVRSALASACDIEVAALPSVSSADLRPANA